MKLTIESISAFNGLDVLVAREEGLFAAEGLDVQIARPRSGERGSVDARSRHARSAGQQPGPTARSEVDALAPEDFDIGRIQLIRLGPIPERDARWAWEWMVSWGILEGEVEPASQLDNRVAERVAAD